MGSSSKMKRRGSLSLVHGVVLAATAAALAAVMTMLGAAFSFLDRTNDDLETLISSSTGRIVSHTLRSTSVQTSVGCSDKGTTRTTGMTILDAHNQHQDHIYEVDKKVHTTTQEVKASDTENMYAPASTINAIEVTDKSDKGLRVAWLMSFPNSGTSYTIHLVRQASNATTATNYALEGDIKDAVSIPAIPGRTNGPFLELIPTIETNLPPKYILTKTHCGGFCSNCLPTNYIETPRSFQISCLSGRSAVRSSNSTGLVIEQVHYSSDLVKKAVHLIRDPFSNIVARFHLERKRHTRWNNMEWLEEHPNDRYGFQKWCTDVDASDELVEARWVDSDLSAALKAGVPCHAEFFRYIQWHDLAFTTARNMGIQTIVLHYEGYRDNHSRILDDLLQFLELPRVEQHYPEFEAGKEYHEFYTDIQRQAVANLVREQASLETWQHMKGYYFGPELFTALQ